MAAARAKRRKVLRRSRSRWLPGWKARARGVSRAPTKASEALLISSAEMPNCHWGSRILGGQAPTTSVARKIPNSASDRASKTPAKEESVVMGEEMGVGDLDCTNGMGFQQYEANRSP